jgi:hypothetical protein
MARALVVPDSQNSTYASAPKQENRRGACGAGLMTDNPDLWIERFPPRKIWYGPRPAYDKTL